MSRVLLPYTIGFTLHYPMLFSVFIISSGACISVINQTTNPTQRVSFHRRVKTKKPIGLYRDVWIAAIASSRKSLTTLLVVMCNTSQ